MKEIQLNTIFKSKPNYKKYKAIIDDEDFEKVNKYKWCAAEVRKGKFYAAGNVNNKYVYMHTFITGFKQTDHIDNNGLNNQRNNLRKATTAENCRNVNKSIKKKYSSCFKGVSKIKNGYRVHISVNGENIYLGFYNDERKAAQIYNKAAVKYHGKFANLNQI